MFTVGIFLKCHILPYVASCMYICHILNKYQTPPLSDQSKIISYWLHILQESGPCTVGDEASDPELMHSLEAKLIKQLGNNQ